MGEDGKTSQRLSVQCRRFSLFRIGIFIHRRKYCLSYDDYDEVLHVLNNELEINLEGYLNLAKNLNPKYVEYLEELEMTYEEHLKEEENRN